MPETDPAAVAGREGRASVIFVSHSARLLGAERSLLTLVRGLRDTGAVSPLLVLPCEGPLGEVAAASGLDVMVLRYFNWIGRRWAWLEGLWALPANALSVLRASWRLKNRQIDLVYTNSLASPFGAALAKLLGVGHVWHAREFVHEDMGCRFAAGTALSMGFVRRTSSRVICNSRALRSKLARWLEPGHLRVIYNGFDFSGFAGPPVAGRWQRLVGDARPIELLMVGSVAASKGQADGIRALAALRARGHAVRLNIVGGGEKRELRRLKRLARELSAEDAVVWHGVSRDVLSHYRRAAVVLLCSRSESFGRVAVEAMAAGTPVVCSNSGALPEIVEDGVTGLLYPPSDIELLADRVEALLRDRELYDAICRRAATSARERFPAEGYVARVKALIDEVLESRTPVAEGRSS